MTDNVVDVMDMFAQAGNVVAAMAIGKSTQCALLRDLSGLVVLVTITAELDVKETLEAVEEEQNHRRKVPRSPQMEHAGAVRDIPA